jgi:hypothetical protein
MKKFIFVFAVLLFTVFTSDPYAADIKKDGKSLQQEFSESSEGDAVSLQVNGVGTLKDDVTAARKTAISDGLRIAVEQARGVMVKSETEVKDYESLRDDILSKTKGFVKTYKILNEIKEDNVYKVTLEVEVMLSDPQTAAPVKMDEQKYNAGIPKIIEEAKILFIKTDRLEELARRRGLKQADIGIEDIKRLHRRYAVMLQVLKHINPPDEKRERLNRLIEAVRLKMKATAIFGRAMAKAERPLFLKRGFELNRKGNHLIGEFGAR